MLLFDLRVLLVEPDADSAKAMAAYVRDEGAKVLIARDAAEATAVVRQTFVDVVVCELDLPDFDGHALLRALRGSPRAAGLPAVALTARRNLLEHALMFPERFEKYLAKPVRHQDLVDAVCCVVGDRKIPSSGAPVSLEAIGDGLVVHDYRFMLGALNAPTPYRYTAMLRFEESEVTSIWTFDREMPTHDPFVQGVPVSETPCAVLRESGGPLVIDDAHDGAWLLRVLAPFRIRAFAGVPLGTRADKPLGVLCHFDESPRPRQPDVLEHLERAARMIRLAKRLGPHRSPS